MSELFGDVDALLRRVEQLPAVLDVAAQRLDVAAADVSRCCDQMKVLMAGLQGSARDELSAMLSRRAADAATTAAEQARDEIRIALREALGTALHEQAACLLERRERERRQELWILVGSMALLALCAAATVLTAVTM